MNWERGNIHSDLGTMKSRLTNPTASWSSSHSAACLLLDSFPAFLFPSILSFRSFQPMDGTGRRLKGRSKGKDFFFLTPLCVLWGLKQQVLLLCCFCSSQTALSSTGNSPLGSLSIMSPNFFDSGSTTSFNSCSPKRSSHFLWWIILGQNPWLSPYTANSSHQPNCLALLSQYIQNMII